MVLDRLEKIIGVKADETEPVVDLVDDSFYRESEPTTAGFFRERIPTTGGAVAYLKSLFPFLSWIFHYNVTWLIGDLVAGESFSISS
jgi:sodium-independent sulfate anion transporter 11